MPFFPLYGQNLESYHQFGMLDITINKYHNLTDPKYHNLTDPTYEIDYLPENKHLNLLKRNKKSFAVASTYFLVDPYMIL